jgi:hypothetical protein
MMQPKSQAMTLTLAKSTPNTGSGVLFLDGEERSKERSSAEADLKGIFGTEGIEGILMLSGIEKFGTEGIEGILMLSGIEKAFAGCATASAGVSIKSSNSTDLHIACASSADTLPGET